MIDRRELLQRAAALLGGAVSASAAAGVLAGCAATPQTAGDGAAHEWLTAEEARTAAAMADRILPRTDTPGVLDVGGLAFIDRMMAGYYQDRERAILREGLARADSEAQAAHSRPFAAITPEQQIALMTVWDREAYEHNRRYAPAPDAPPHFFRMMKELATLGFFTSEYGASEFLKYAATPGEWRADIPYADVGKAWAT